MPLTTFSGSWYLSLVGLVLTHIEHEIDAFGILTFNILFTQYFIFFQCALVSTSLACLLCRFLICAFCVPQCIVSDRIGRDMLPITYMHTHHSVSARRIVNEATMQSHYMLLFRRLMQTPSRRSMRALRNHLWSYFTLCFWVFVRSQWYQFPFYHELCDV